jgi:hypothetical protein
MAPQRPKTTVSGLVRTDLNRRDWPRAMMVNAQITKSPQKKSIISPETHTTEAFQRDTAPPVTLCRKEALSSLFA